MTWNWSKQMFGFPFTGGKAHTYQQQSSKRLPRGVHSTVAGSLVSHTGNGFCNGVVHTESLFVLENEGTETRQAGAGVRRQTGECHHCTCFPRCPLWTILICSKSEIYTEWLRLHHVSKMSSPVLLGGHVLPFCWCSGQATWSCRVLMSPRASGRSAQQGGSSSACPGFPASPSFRSVTCAFSEQRPKCWKCADVHVCS